MNQTAVFDLFDIFANELIGDLWLFVIIGIVVIFFLAMRFKMPFELSLLFGGLWIAIVFAETKLIILWVFLILAIGSFYYYIISRPIRRG